MTINEQTIAVCISMMKLQTQCALKVTEEYNHVISLMQKLKNRQNLSMYCLGTDRHWFKKKQKYDKEVWSESDTQAAFEAYIIFSFWLGYILLLFFKLYNFCIHQLHIESLLWVRPCAGCWRYNSYQVRQVLMEKFDRN